MFVKVLHSGGSVPVALTLCRANHVNDVKELHSAGKVGDAKEAKLTNLSVSSDVNVLYADGKVDELKPKFTSSSCCKFVSCAYDAGKPPVTLLFTNIMRCVSSCMLPNDPGRVPSRLLFQNLTFVILFAVLQVT